MTSSQTEMRGSAGAEAAEHASGPVLDNARTTALEVTS